MHQLNQRLFLMVMLISCCLPGWAYSSNLDELIEQAEFQAGTGQYMEALELLQQALQLAPDSSLVYTRLGGIQLLRQRYREGIEHFQQAITLDQANAQAFIGMAIGYLHLGRYNLARAALNEAERLDPAKQPEIDKVLAWLDQRSAIMAH